MAGTEVDEIDATLLTFKGISDRSVWSEEFRASAVACQSLAADGSTRAASPKSVQLIPNPQAWRLPYHHMAKSSLSPKKLQLATATAMRSTLISYFPGRAVASDALHVGQQLLEKRVGI